MNLQKIKDDVSKAGFSEDGLNLINSILDKAIKRDKLEKSEKDEICGIIEIEIEVAKIEIDAKQQTAQALLEFSDGVDAAVEKAVDEIENLDKELSAKNTVPAPEK